MNDTDLKLILQHKDNTIEMLTKTITRLQEKVSLQQTIIELYKTENQVLKFGEENEYTINDEVQLSLDL